MNGQQIINMILRTVMRKLINKGVDAGMNRMGGGAQQQGREAQRAARQARRAARMANRF
ncbi:hypothetical protein [Antarctobacter jejuensis]|uniref:hypothetical protein n=1 Tax=Antarctobacter jejuensis TaxID=1439938 RepID=UPI003FD555D5